MYDCKKLSHTLFGMLFVLKIKTNKLVGIIVIHWCIVKVNTKPGMTMLPEG